MIQDINCFIDGKFKVALKKGYTDFNVITQPLLSRLEIISIIDEFKSKLSDYFKAQMTLFGFDKKESEARNKHLKDSAYYSRLVLYQYMIQNRIRFNHRFPFWVTTNTAAAYAKGNNYSSIQSFLTPILYSNIFEENRNMARFNGRIYSFAPKK